MELFHLKPACHVRILRWRSYILCWVTIWTGVSHAVYAEAVCSTRGSCDSVNNRVSKQLHSDFYLYDHRGVAEDDLRSCVAKIGDRRVLGSCNISGIDSSWRFMTLKYGSTRFPTVHDFEVSLISDDNFRRVSYEFCRIDRLPVVCVWNYSPQHVCVSSIDVRGHIVSRSRRSDMFISFDI